jgi:peroxiredoxin
VRFLVILALVAACRPDPVPLNPHKQQAPRTKEIDRDVSLAPAPDALVKKRDGTEFDLAALWAKEKDQKVVVVFYRGGWCPYCKKQLAELQEHYRDFMDAKAVVVGVSNEEGAASTALREKLGLGFELYSDPELAMITKWGVEDTAQKIAKPATFVVQPGGMISWRKIGDKPSDHPTMEELLAALQ